MQVSEVQMLLSSQVSVTPAMQLPVVVLQVSMPLQALLSSHLFGCWQLPSMQVSEVQMSPSLQLSGVPAMQMPVTGLQVSVPLQASPSSHFGVLQFPLMHVSMVQMFPSATQFIGILEQVPKEGGKGLQKSLVHGSLSSQRFGFRQIPS